MHRLFLDANVLFSAAYRDDSGLLRLWDLKGAELVTSAYALEEARRNCADARLRERLEELAGRMTVHRHSLAVPSLPSGLDIPEKDRPILGVAISVEATHLVTGDRRAFGAFFGKRISGVEITRPADYLAAARGNPPQ